MNEAEKWPATIERQSNMTAMVEIPPPFEILQTGMQGTGELFIARVCTGRPASFGTRRETLRSHTVRFLQMSSEIIRTLPYTMKFLVIKYRLHG